MLLFQVKYNDLTLANALQIFQMCLFVMLSFSVGLLVMSFCPRSPMANSYINISRGRIDLLVLFYLIKALYKILAAVSVLTLFLTRI